MPQGRAPDPHSHEMVMRSAVCGLRSVDEIDVTLPGTRIGDTLDVNGKSSSAWNIPRWIGSIATFQVANNLECFKVIWELRPSQACTAAFNHSRPVPPHPITCRWNRRAYGRYLPSCGTVVYLYYLRM